MVFGKRTDARQTFASALAIVANVTQTFPLNEDAGFLSLQILKATNEADFQSSLPNRIDDAAALLKKNPPAGYARIADLSHIEPNNSRLGRLLVQAEIAIGKRRPEPTASQKAQSLRLAEQARQLIKTGRAVDLTRAEQLLAQAMELDPNDRDAQTVSLNIQTLKGGGPEKVLGLTDSQNLNEARLYFSQGQYNQARDTLNALLKSEGTKTRDVLLLDQQLNQLNY
jgi:tetratricopeptide (TPR) repeat protein